MFFFLLATHLLTIIAETPPNGFKLFVTDLFFWWLIIMDFNFCEGSRKKTSVT